MEQDIYLKLQNMLEKNEETQQEIRKQRKDKIIACAGGSVIIIGILGAFLSLLSKNIGLGLIPGVLLTIAEATIAVALSTLCAGGVNGTKEVIDCVISFFKHNYQRELKALEVEKNFINNAIEKYNEFISKTENKVQYECVMPREIKYLKMVNSLLPVYAKHGMKLIKDDIKGELILNNYSTEEANILVDMACEEQKIKTKGR